MSFRLETLWDWWCGCWWYVKGITNVRIYPQAIRFTPILTKFEKSRPLRKCLENSTYFLPREITNSVPELRNTIAVFSTLSGHFYCNIYTENWTKISFILVELLVDRSSYVEIWEHFPQTR